MDSLVAEEKLPCGPENWGRCCTRIGTSRNPLLLIVLGVSAAVLVAIIMYLSLRARARARLKQQKKG